MNLPRARGISLADINKNSSDTSGEEDDEDSLDGSTSSLKRSQIGMKKSQGPNRFARRSPSPEA